MSKPLPNGPGTALFGGDGAWLPPAKPGSAPGLEALALCDPVRVLIARTAVEVPGLLDQVQREQESGRYVAGYLAYEAGAAFGLEVRPAAGDALPLAWMAVYEPESTQLIEPPAWERLLAGPEVSSALASLADTQMEHSVSQSEYEDAVQRVREYIAAGDTYQINYTIRSRFSLGEGVDPLHYFLALARRQSVPYAAYFDLGESQVISLSPELFLRRRGRRLESRPMKGTRPRGQTHVEDVALAYEQAETVKERAENLMIVDMVRNDLGRVCRAGSVKVPALYAVEPYRTVWQMVSTVVGDVNPKAGLADIMQAVFPGASITGAPKHHTMELIASLETEPRGVYTGAVGLFVPGGDFTCNIAIRTITHHKGRCLLGVGSGIVWDAVPSAEYDETLLKATFATPATTADDSKTAVAAASPSRAAADVTAQEGFHLFETLLLDTGEPEDLSRFRYLDEHLDRMEASAQALGLELDRASALDKMSEVTRGTQGAAVARVYLDASGRLGVSTRRAPEPPADPVTLLVSPFRTDPDDVLLHHKTSLRGFYDREYRRAADQGHFDVVFLNRLDRVTEGAITNLFARFGDRWVTPPLEDGLLPGIWRAGFMAEKSATQRSLTLAELSQADQVVVGNSVRGAAQVASLVTDPVAY